MWTTYALDLGERFIPIGGMTELNVAYRKGGVAAMEDADDPEIVALLRRSAEDLKSGLIKAIGTVFINNSRSHTMAAFRRKARGDASSVRRLYSLVAEHGAILVVHMHPDADSLAQFEPLMATDRRARGDVVAVRDRRHRVSAAAHAGSPPQSVLRVVVALPARSPPPTSSRAISSMPRDRRRSGAS